MKMTATKKRLLSGMLVGAVLLAGTISYAGAAAAQDNGQANARMERRDNMRPGQMPQLDASKIAKHVAEQFGVKESEVLAALNDKRNFRDITYTAILAKISGKSFSDVLAMKSKDNHWRDVQKSLGVTKEQVRAEQIEMTAAHLAIRGDCCKTAIARWTLRWRHALRRKRTRISRSFWTARKSTIHGGMSPRNSAWT